MNVDRKIFSEAIRATTRATDAHRAAARKAAFELRGTPFVFNGFLMLVLRGAPTTESNILSEAKKLAAANDRHFGKGALEAEPCR